MGAGVGLTIGFIFGSWTIVRCVYILICPSHPSVPQLRLSGKDYGRIQVRVTEPVLIHYDSLRFLGVALVRAAHYRHYRSIC